MSNGNEKPPPMTWQDAAVAVGKYLVDHLPTIIAAVALAWGGCHATNRLEKGQAVTHQILEDHADKIDQAAASSAAVKAKLDKKENDK